MCERLCDLASENTEGHFESCSRKSLRALTMTFFFFFCPPQPYSFTHCPTQTRHAERFKSAGNLQKEALLRLSTKPIH